VKNIILIISDTFRYDNLGEKATRPVRTPELDRFAAERATSVERVTMGSFPTIPHRTDLTRGVLGWPHHPWQPLRASGPNHAPILLGKQGYVSQLICDCPHLFKVGFQLGFSAAFQNRGQEGDNFMLHMNDPIEQTMPPEKTRPGRHFQGRNLPDMHRWINRYFSREDETFCSKTANTTIRWLEDNCNGGPFFLWVDFFDPHEPWDPPEYMVRRYDPDYDGTPMIHPNYGRSSDYTPEELHNLWAHYAAESELVDRHVGRVLQKIDDLQLWDDSIVLFTADHGTSIGEHERTAKSNINDNDDRFWPIYPEVGRVPFLIAGGGTPAGKSLELMAQPIDILPTLCELAGADVEPDAPFEGKSFASQILAGEGAHRDIAVSGSFIDAEGKSTVCNDARTTVTPFVATEEWGYTPVGPDGERELYDLTRDPLAEVNIIADAEAEADRLHQALLDHLAEHGASDEFLALWRSS